MNHGTPQQDPEPLAPEQLANLGIFPPIEQRYDDEDNPFWVVRNQKILVIDPELLTRIQSNAGGQEEERNTNNQERVPRRQEATAPRNRAQEQPLSGLLTGLAEFLHSLILLLIAWLRWLLGRSSPSEPARKDPVPVPDDGFFIDQDNNFTWSFKDNPKRKVKFRIIRTLESPNDDSEYEGRPSASILVEWNGNPDSGDLTPFPGLYDQADNQFLINPELSSRPSHPPQQHGEVIRVYDSDFKEFTFQGMDNDQDYYHPIATDHGTQPIVAVMDTGITYKWVNTATNTRGRHFPFDVNEAYGRSFLVAEVDNNHGLNNVPNFGYCGITEYLRRPVQSNILRILNGIPPERVRQSPYDDNLVDERVPGNENGTVVNERVGRHGTIISAILNQPHPEQPELGCQVLPVKVFNCAGMGTLYDVLDGCNYLLACRRAGVPIPVMNASFTGSLDIRGRNMLFRKMRAMTEVYNMWIVAAAGNQRINLNDRPLYPASFGVPVAPGGLGLERVITVTSAYSEGGIVGNSGGAVSVVVRSAFADGFQSVLPIVNNERLRGTSFAAPYVVAVLAHAQNINSRAAALAHLFAHPVPGVVSFEPPIPGIA